MNKVLILLLAICIVYAHAFVRREAVSPKEENFMENAAKSLQKMAEEGKEKLSEVFDPESVKKGFNDLVDNINKAFSNLKPENAKQ
ncbi:hypothetical protein KGM_210761 [Danaus plexippus plexippus]|uniref:Uncharacterized protein n=1 Tax=Danaus plexippus plexippus TaxID=278856 RepID=A0A212FJY8_DANPL|nr:hypothetical protein KGM_210761 [Danaus plexippus plexippus]